MDNNKHLPSSREVIAMIREYCERAGINYADFARRIRYSANVIYTFMAGNYGKKGSGGKKWDDCAIRKCALDFMEENPVGTPRVVEGTLYETENTRLIRQYFYAALDNSCAYYFRGAPGCQKTFVLEHLIAELHRSELPKNGHGRRAYRVYCREGIRPGDLMKRVAVAVGSIGTGNIDRIFSNLRFDFGRRKILLCFDEAQHLSVECLETVRELLDEVRCGLLFAGSHQLENTFKRLDMEQWASRLVQGAELPGVSEQEAASIIRTELGDLSEKKIAAVIGKCRATDLRKGMQVQYISARMLFWSIQGIKERAKGTAQ
jgi:DNA transposition AAA+ family ATPase